MEMLLLPSIFMRKIKPVNNLVKCQYLVAILTLSISSIGFATVPINDSDLTNSFLNNETKISQIASAQLIESDSLIKQLEEKKLQDVRDISKNNLDSLVKKSLPLVSISNTVESESKNITNVIEEISALVKAKKISNSIDNIDNNERKTILLNNDPLFAFNILNEISLYETDSESYRWNGKLSQSYDLSDFNNIYYDSSSGSYEFSNISGIVQIYVEPYSDDRGYRFRRANYVF